MADLVCEKVVHEGENDGEQSRVDQLVQRAERIRRPVK